MSIRTSVTIQFCRDVEHELIFMFDLHGFSVDIYLLVAIPQVWKLPTFGSSYVAVVLTHRGLKPM